MKKILSVLVDIDSIYIFAPRKTSESSSVGRAQPCQG